MRTMGAELPIEGAAAVCNGVLSARVRQQGGPAMTCACVACCTHVQQRAAVVVCVLAAATQAEMENVHFEKKQLLAQWKSSLLAIQK